MLAYMYSKSEEDRLRLLRARGVVRTIWINPVIAEREEKGEHHLITDMRAYPEWFYEYMRMTPEQFDQIHSLIREDIRKMDTNYRDAIPTEHKLAAVLWWVKSFYSKIYLLVIPVQQLPPDSPHYPHIFCCNGYTLAMARNHLGITYTPLDITR